MKWLARIFGRRQLVATTRSREDLDARADAFVRCGLDLETFNALEHEDLLAILRASERMWAVRAAKLAAAIRSEKGRAELLAPFDDGLALRTLEALELLERTPVAEEV